MDATEGWITLAFEGAQTLVRSMDVAAIWNRVSTVVAQIIGRGYEDSTTEQEQQLEEDRKRLSSAKAADREALEQEIVTDWKVRLKDALKKDPAAVDQLRTLLAEVAEDSSASPAFSENVTQKAKGHGRNYYARGDQYFGRAQ